MDFASFVKAVSGTTTKQIFGEQIFGLLETEETLSNAFSGKGYVFTTQHGCICSRPKVRISNLGHDTIECVSVIYWGKTGGRNFLGEFNIPYEVAFIGKNGSIIYDLGHDEDFYDVMKFETIEEVIKHIEEKLSA